MSENKTIQCPFGDSCPQTLTNQSKLDLLAQKIELQNTHTNQKLDEVCGDLKEIKTFLNEKLDEKIDERVAIALDKVQARMFRWLIVTLLGSGGLSTLLTLLLK